MIEKLRICMYFRQKTPHSVETPILRPIIRSASIARSIGCAGFDRRTSRRRTDRHRGLRSLYYAARRSLFSRRRAMVPIDTEAIKRDNEAIIRMHGGQICDWLPSPDPDAPQRDVGAVARRALILNAMLQVAFKAPIPIIKRWISD